MKIIKRFLCLSIVIPVVLLGGCNHANSSVQSSLEENIKQVTLGDLEINFDKEIIGDRIETDKPLFQSYLDIVAGGSYKHNVLTYVEKTTIMLQTYKTQQGNNYYVKTLSANRDGPIENLGKELLLLNDIYYIRDLYSEDNLKEVPANRRIEPTDPISAIMRDDMKYVSSHNVVISGEDFIREEWERYNSERAETISCYMYFKNDKLVSINHISPKDTLTVIYIIEFENEADESKLVEPK